MHTVLPVLTSQLWRVCIFRSSPVALPAQPVFALIMALTATLIQALAMTIWFNGTWIESVGIACFTTITLCTMLCAMAAFKGQKAEIGRMLGAWFGADIIFAVLICPVLIYAHARGMAQVGHLVYPAVIFFYAWEILVKGMIVSQSTKVGIFLAVIATACFTAVANISSEFLVGM